MTELTNTEKALLGVMFNNFDNVIRFSEEIVIDGNYYTSNDLFKLACKLGIEDYM